MAFKPVYTQSYKLIAKHSGLALSIPNTSDVIQVEQHKTGALKMQQDFRFETEPHRVFIMPEYKNRFLCVHNSSQDPGTPIIRYKWEVKQNNQFLFLYSGEGYYRIRTYHSGQFFDISEVSMVEGGKLVQYPLTGADNQLFRPQLVSGKSGVPAISFVEANEMVRTVVLALISKIPEVGGGLSFITGFFWKEEDKLANIWQQMKDYVEMRINTKIMDERVKTLDSHLAGIISVIREIEESTETDRGTLLRTVIHTMRAEEALLFDGSIEMLPYITQFGTVMITLRRIFVTSYKDYYGHEEPDEKTKNTNMNYLKDTINNYKGAVVLGMQAAMDKRISQIKDRQTKTWNETTKDYRSSNEESWAEDTYSGWSQKWSYNTTRYTRGGSTSTEGWKDHESRADFAVEQRRNQIKEQYASMLEEFLNIADEWQYLVPGTTRPTGVKRQKTVGKYGGKDAGTTTTTVSDNSGRISKISVHTVGDSQICGIEVFYNGASSGFLGKRGEEHTLDIAEDDYITGVMGIALVNIKALSLCTHKGKLLEAGFGGKASRTEDYFYADLSDGLDAKLIGIFGNGGDNVQQLSFKWEYAIKDPK